MITRRNLLHMLGATGFCSAMPKLTLARAPGDNRFVVILLRGAIDGLDVVRPVGDRAYGALRGEMPNDKAVDLDGFFALHPGLAGVAPLFKAGEMSAIHAVATPYRERSHFDGQDLLEMGSGVQNKSNGSGWLNRLLAVLDPSNRNLGVDIGNGSELIFEGKQPVQNWYPDVRVDLSFAGSQFLKLLYKDDPILEPSFNDVEQMVKSTSNDGSIDPGITPRELAKLAAKFLNGDARIAAFSITGWDTHVGQLQRLGRLLPDLAATITQLKASLGANWDRTAVLMVSEFGRTARLNGTKGTDHGTGTAALLAGGILKGGAGGKVLTTKWPGLADGQLYQDRDLLPTDDVRRYAGWLIEALYGVGIADIQSQVFPGLDAGSRIDLI